MYIIQPQEMSIYEVWIHSTLPDVMRKNDNYILGPSEFSLQSNDSCHALSARLCWQEKRHITLQPTKSKSSYMYCAFLKAIRLCIIHIFNILCKSLAFSELFKYYNSSINFSSSSMPRRHINFLVQLSFV